LVHVAGAPVAFAAEIDREAANIDHFWITLGTATGESRAENERNQSALQ
jgi:hypothetical protein